MNVGTLTIEMAANVARLRQDMDAAKRTVDGAMRDIQKSVAVAKGALAGLGVGLSVGAFASIIKGSIDSAAALNDLAIQTGATVESLSALASVGKLTDTSAQTIAGAMNKLAKNMAGATEDSKGAGKALEALGVDFATFSRLRPEEQMQALAIAMDKFEDGGGKAAVAMALLGKEGATLLPFMKDLASAGELQAKVTTAQAAAADNFNDNLTRITATSKAWSKELAMGMVPALDLAAQAFLDVMNGTGGVREEVRKLSADGSIKSWTESAITGLTYVGDAAEYAWRFIKIMGQSLGGYAAAAVALMTGEFRQAKNILSEIGQDVGSAIQADTFGQRLRARMEELRAMGPAATEAKKALNFTNVLADSKGAAEKFAEALDALLAKINGKDAGLDADFQKNLALLKRGYDEGKLSLDQYVATVESYIKQQKFYQDEVKESERRLEEYNKAVQKQYEEEQKAKQSAEALIEQIQFEAAALKMTNAQREEAIKLRELERNGIKKGTAEYEEYAQRIKDAVAGKSAVEASIEQQKKAQEEWGRTWDQIGQSLSDALMDGGRSAADYIKGLFRNMVLRPLIQAVMSPIGATIGTMMGVPTAANAATGASSIFSTGSTLATLAGSAGAFGSGVMSGLTAWGTGGSVTGLLSSGSSLFAGGIANGLGTLAGALGPIALGIGALYALSKRFGGETRTGGQYESANFVAGPSGGQIEGATQAITATMQSINATLEALGATDRLGRFVSGIETSGRGKGFAYAGGTLSSGVSFGQGTDGLGYMNRRGSKSTEEALADFSEELKQATLQALQSADVPGQLGDYLRSLGDIDALSGGQLDAALNRINTALLERQALEERLYQLTATDAEKLARARERELAAIDPSNRALLEQVYAQEDLRAAAEAAGEAMDDLGNSLRTAAEIARERESLERQLLQLQGNTAELRARELAGLDESNRALQNQIYAIQDANAAVEAAASVTDRAFSAVQRAIGDAAQRAEQALTDTFNAFAASVDAQKKAAEAARQAATENVNALTSIFDMLKSEVADLLGEAAVGMTAAQGGAFIERALATARATGYLPDQEELSTAIRAARSGLSSGSYSTAFELRRDRLILAGRLTELQGIAGDQMTVAERQLSVAEDQLLRLDEQLEQARSQYEAEVAASRQYYDAMLMAAQNQINALRGVSSSIASLETAIAALASAARSESSARAAASAAGSSSSPATGSGYNQMLEAAKALYYSVNGGYSTALYNAAAAPFGGSFEMQQALGWDGSREGAAAIRAAYGFAAGGLHDGGVRIVGENGPELEVTGPARYYSASATADMLVGGASVSEELRQLRLENQAQARAMVQLQSRVTRLLERWDGDGLPETRSEAA